MVLLGGLEILAAGYIIHKHKENKQERLRRQEEEEEEEEARRTRARDARHRAHSRRKNQHHSAPPRDRKGECKTSHRPPLPSKIHYAHSAEPVMDAKVQAPYPIPHSFIPPNLQPHHTPQDFSPAPYARLETYQNEQVYRPEPYMSQQHISNQPYPQPQQPAYSDYEYPSHLAELSAEPHQRHPSSILRQHSGERRRSSGEHVRFAIPHDQSHLDGELHATTPPPPYIP